MNNFETKFRNLILLVAVIFWTTSTTNAQSWAENTYNIYPTSFSKSVVIGSGAPSFKHKYKLKVDGTADGRGAIFGLASGARTAIYGYNASTTTGWAGFFRGRTYLSGDVGIGTFSFPNTVGGANISNYKLFVRGGILADEVRVRTAWADYVFDKNYDLKSLKQVEEYIEENGHLPNVPSAKTVEADGIEIGNITKIQQEKIEELTLYLIQQQKEIEALKEENAQIKKEQQMLKTIAERLAKVEATLKTK